MIDTETYTIFVVEDNPGLCRLIQINLERAGYKIHSASSVWQARDYLKTVTEKVLMLLDYKLGDVPATELLDQLDELHIAVPFIVVTGKGSEQVAVDMMKRGARDYIVKNPDLVDQLPPLIARVIENLEREHKRKIYGTPDVHGRQV